MNREICQHGTPTDLPCEDCAPMLPAKFDPIDLSEVGSIIMKFRNGAIRIGNTGHSGRMLFVHEDDGEIVDGVWIYRGKKS